MSSLYVVPRVHIPIDGTQLRSKAIETMIVDTEEDRDDAIEEIEEDSEDKDVEDAMENDIKDNTIEATTEKEGALGVKSEHAINHEIDFSDRIFKRMWAKDPIVVESHKLLFFNIPKNATSLFKKLFRRMMGFSDWFTVNPHTTNDLMYLGEYSRDEQLEMMTSPEWTRAIFVRDPLERALSAYLDKGLHGDVNLEDGVKGHYLKKHCCGMHEEEGVTQDIQNAEVCHTAPFAPYDNPLNASNFPFEAFVDQVMKGCHDAHWLPQKARIDKDSNWDFINFVGKFENKMEDTHLMLKKIGAFEEFGKSGWGMFEGKSLSIFESNLAIASGHGTGSHSKIDEHYTPALKERVFEHYKEDYEFELFDFTNPIER